MKKICFISLGCSRNLVDTEIMVKFLVDNKYELTDLTKADFLIVNSCAFIKEAREESINVIREVFKNKKKDAKVIVTGCMTNIFLSQLKKIFKKIFFYLGPGNLEDIIKAVTSEKKGEVITKKSYLENFKKDFRILSTKPNFAYLKIAEGCSKRCSYCLIPSIKGSLKSKEIDQVVYEFKSLLNKGVYEVILIAQDLSDYGKDLNEKKGLEKLLKKLLTIKKNFWIRLLYLYPDGITDSLIDIIKSDERICNYVDIPIQHVNDDILKKMRRGVDKKKIFSIIEKLKKRIEDIVIRTTLMVGFPNETEKKFLELLDFIKYFELDHVGVFKFSREKGTKAYHMKEQIFESVKKDRLKKLYQIQKKIVEKKNRFLIGKNLEVFIEEYNRSSNLLLSGRYYGQAPEIDPVILINNSSEVKEFYKKYLVKITGFSEYDLIGKVI